MKLISINVATPVNVELEQKVVSTGIFKQAVSGTVTVGQFNLEGDGQADLVNHGGEHKAVYGFSADHYDYWQATLGLSQLPAGKFGENLTISGLDEKALCIGDRLQINDCVLEISQPRVPCFKLGMTFQRKDMPKLFTQHAATGIYFRVIQPGTIQAGDEVQIQQRHPAALSVQQLFRAYFDRDMNADEAQQTFATAMNIDALSNEWRQKVVERLQAA